MTTKQRLEYMLHQAAENKEGHGKGDPVEETVEGKKVIIQRVGYGRKVYGHHAPEFEAYVNGKSVFMWRHGRKQVLEALYKKVSDAHIAKIKKQLEQYEQERAAREAKEKAEQKAKEERERPARELAAALMTEAFSKMVDKHGEEFTAEELTKFLRSAG